MVGFICYDIGLFNIIRILKFHTLVWIPFSPRKYRKNPFCLCIKLFPFSKIRCLAYELLTKIEIKFSNSALIKKQKYSKVDFFVKTVSCPYGNHRNGGCESLISLIVQSPKSIKLTQILFPTLLFHH